MQISNSNVLFHEEAYNLSECVEKLNQSENLETCDINGTRFPKRKQISLCDKYLLFVVMTSPLFLREL